MFKIGFIGFNEAAFCITDGLREEGAKGIVAYDALRGHPTIGAQVASRAEKTGVELLDSACAVAERTDLLFAAVPSSYTLDVCTEIAEVPGESAIMPAPAFLTPRSRAHV